MGEGNILATSDIAVLEAGFWARSTADHDRIVSGMREGALLLPLGAALGAVAVELQSRLVSQGRGRAVGVLDLLHAATAIVHNAVVVHYDADFEQLASVDPRLRHQWIVPRGSVD